MIRTEHRRDAGVVFENPPQNGSAGPAGWNVTAASAQSKQERTHGIVYGPEDPPLSPAPGASARVAAEPLPKKEEPPPPVKAEAAAKPAVPPLPVARPAAAVHSHDAGIVLDNGETIRQARNHAAKEKPNLSSMLLSMIELGGATAQFAVHQFRTGFRILTNPSNAIEITDHSIQKIIKAINAAIDTLEETK